MSNTNKPQYTDFDLGPHSYDLYAWGLEPVAQLNNQNHSQGEWVNIEDYRKLERERNDARDTKWAREIHSCHNECARPMCVLRRERDEARKDVDSLLWVLAAIQDAIGCGCGGDYGLCEDCSSAYNKTDALIKARETNQPKP
jgi:hypothetical protein